MITEVPSYEHFEQVATDLLNLAWTSAADLTHNLDVATAGWDDDEGTRQIADEYRSAAQRPLVNALSLVQQAMEFLLKGRIAAVSPFILLAGGPDEWPSGCDRIDKPFADFKMIDAHDLIRAHNTVVSDRLSEDFRSFFNDLRRLRNTTTHTVAHDHQITECDIYLYILKTVAHLLKPRKWVDIRRAYLDRDPIAILHSTDFSPARLAQDITGAIGVLTPADALTYFGFDKRAHAYHCPSCVRRCADGELGIGEGNPALAQLVEKTPSCDRAKCILCGRMIEVTRQTCAHDDCDGNVIEKYTQSCMTCNRYQPGSEMDYEVDF